MGNIFKLSAILFFVAAFAAGLLAYYNSMTAPVIAKMNLAKEEEARKYVMPDAVEFKAVKYASDENDKYFEAIDKDGKTIGYVYLSKKNGFSGVVETMVGTDTNFKIIDIKVVKHSETPGLGAEAQKIKYGEAKPFFEEWFIGKNALKVVVVNDDKNSADKVQSITGSTITTRAVCRGINIYSEMVKETIEKGGN